MAMPIDDIRMVNGGDDGFPIGGGNSFALFSPSAPSQLVGENVPTQRFDLSAIANLRPQDKYLGRNLVNDIREAYQTYITGAPVGRGGQYAVSAARTYGTTITEAARGYLVAVGLPTLADVLPDTGGGTGGSGTGGGTDNALIKQLKETQDALQKQIEELKKGFASNNTVKVLSDSIKDLFGNAVYNPPLQSQATGYTPVTTSSPIGGAVTGGGSNIGTFVILGVVGVIAYFVYKRFTG